MDVAIPFRTLFFTMNEVSAEERMYMAIDQ